VTSALHQITVRYDAEEDRALLRVSTSDKTEYRLWLTRRFVGVLWSALMTAMEKDPEAKRNLMPEAKRAVLAMEHHDAVGAADFSQGHDEGFEDMTADDGPALVVGGSVVPGKGGITALILKTRSGPEFNFALNRNLLHALCRLLAESGAKAGWGLDLAVGGDALVVPADKTRVH